MIIFKNDKLYNSIYLSIMHFLNLRNTLKTNSILNFINGTLLTKVSVKVK